MTAYPRVFLEYMSERMREWIPHWQVEHHQQLTRTRTIAEVGKAPAGERLEVLVDWSEKLTLEPNESGTGTTYEKIGLVVGVCVYRSAEGVQSETIAGICESATNDVPHTHAFLRKLLKIFAERSKRQGTTLKRVNVWSDGGPAHFKCAEGFSFSSHLLSELRIVSGNPAALLFWNFMQSYHGKGPYDAEVTQSFMKCLFQTHLLPLCLLTPGWHYQVPHSPQVHCSAIRIYAGVASVPVRTG